MKSKKTKTQIVREYLKSLPSDQRRPTDVATALNERGVKVTRNLVSVVKTQMSRVAPPASDALLMAKRLIETAGDAQRAKELVEVVARIMS